MKAPNLVGQKFGRLAVNSRAGIDKYGHMLWNCICDCGKHKCTSTSSLRIGYVKSCGCFQREMSRINVRAYNKRRGCTGVTHHKLFPLWAAMISRCRNENGKSAKYYVGRGITVCARWRGEHGFENFLADMGSRPAGTTLDRFPNGAGNYELGNCRWATPKQQRANRRNPKVASLQNFSTSELLSELARRQSCGV